MHLYKLDLFFSSYSSCPWGKGQYRWNKVTLQVELFFILQLVLLLSWEEKNGSIFLALRSTLVIQEKHCIHLGNKALSSCSQLSSSQTVRR